MIFFQGILLAGYAYGHVAATRKRKLQPVILHGALMLLAIPFLPLDPKTLALDNLQSGSNPVFQILGLLVISIGLPIFVISTTAPLLQHWFSKTAHPLALDPYFLYSSSNAGSLAALLAYPTLLEPNLYLPQQIRFWTVGYVLLAVLTSLCAAVRWRASVSVESSATNADSEVDSAQAPGLEDHVRPKLFSRFRWTLLALVPSSWMLGLTTYITTDIASAPLFWVVPLSIYLLTFIMAFARRSLISFQACERLLPIGAVALIYLLFSQATEPVWLLTGIHLVVFFLGALACHGRLAAERPDRRYLTEFYLWISFGGVLGGIFNALVAPILFTGIIEYPAAIIAACCLRNSKASIPIEKADRKRKTIRIVTAFLPASLAVASALLLIPNTVLPFQFRMAIVFGVPLILVFLMVDIPWRFGLALACMVVGNIWIPDGHGQTLYAERNFYGVLRVTSDPTGPFRRLVHGSTLHGRQFIDTNRHCEPLSYYHRSGPLRHIFKVAESTSGCTNVAVIGLGVGSTACYSLPHQSWTFYEINPAVIAVAQDTNFFNNLNGCMQAESNIVLGDARLRLDQAPRNAYELMILDAFSSDSIPVHLITREAIRLYLSKLAKNGILAFHISNRSLDLQPVLGDLASDLGMVCFSFNETEIFEFQMAEGKDASHWLVMARRQEHLGNLPRYDPWLPVKPRSRPQIWTDDFSNIVGALNWW